MDLNELKFDNSGLIPAIAQDANTGDVLMLAYMNMEALEKTIETHRAHYYSRSRQKLWLKGEESGHFQDVEGIWYDCDGDTILVSVRQTGCACHTGNRTCFFNMLDSAEQDNIQAVKRGAAYTKSAVLYEVDEVIKDRIKNPVIKSYTNYLIDKGIDKILKKVGEESAEVIIAAKNRSPQEVKSEVADLLYHLTVMLNEQAISWDDVFDELRTRQN